MSRHQIPARQPGLAVTAGWDNPLSTFFAQVTRDENAEDDSDPLVLWLGRCAGEVPRAEDLALPLAPYAELLPKVTARLQADRAECAGRPPTALQRSLLARLGRTP